MEIEPKTPAGYFNYFVERNDKHEAALLAALVATRFTMKPSG